MFYDQKQKSLKAIFYLKGVPMSTITTKNDVIENVNKIEGINGAVISKKELTEKLNEIDGIGEHVISTEDIYLAIVNLDTFESRAAAREVAKIVAGLGVLKQPKTKDIVATIADLGLLNAQPKGKEAVDAVFDTIKESVIAGKQVNIDKFCNFKLGTQAAKPEREGVNPSTGEKITLAAQPEKRVVRIKPSAPFKAAVAAK